MRKTISRESGDITSFRKIIRGYYKEHARDMPWRRTRDPYKILVSEMMLQQTQVSRVLKKYPLFIKLFPDARALARAPLPDVLSAWSGLGYNRRGKFLHQAAHTIVRKHGGGVPDSVGALAALPGIGPGTAGAIAAFAFNEPVVFLETNIRSVFIHYFFVGRRGFLRKSVRHSDILKNVGMSYGENVPKRMRAERKIRDADIMPLVERTLDRKNPREWYYALMDYGAMLKRTYPNPSRRSAQYVKQSPFKNSRRRVRGEILKLLLITERPIPVRDIRTRIQGDPRHARSALKELKKEGFVLVKNKHVSLAEI